MSVYPMSAVGEMPERLGPLKPLVLGNAIPNCDREELHICRVRSVEFLNIIWPWMRAGLLRIKAKNNPRSHWLPEHVRGEVIRGIAGQNSFECFVGHDGVTQSLHGFMVCFPEIDPFVQLPLAWFIWMSNMAEQVMVNPALHAEFERMARERGYIAYRWRSTRWAWARKARKFGIVPAEFVFEKTLTEEHNG